MRSWTSTFLVAALVSLLAFGGAISCHGLVGSSQITGVKFSGDYKRLIIESNGAIGSPRALPSFRPARLILDFDGSVPGQGLQTSKSKKNGIADIQVKATPTGTRIELDFGSVPLPRYRIRKLNDYVIVFLEQGGVPISPNSAPRLHGSAAKPPLPRSHAARKEPVRPNTPKVPAPRARSRDGLLIKSTSVVDGNIVLHVADAKRPKQVYRIQIGVDLRQPGFKAAEIRRSVGKGAKGPS
jgi:AMIN domain